MRSRGKTHHGDRIKTMIGWMTGEERGSATAGERTRAQAGKSDGETEKWGDKSRRSRGRGKEKQMLKMAVRGTTTG